MTTDQLCISSGLKVFPCRSRKEKTSSGMPFSREMDNAQVNLPQLALKGTQVMESRTFIVPQMVSVH